MGSSAEGGTTAQQRYRRLPYLGALDGLRALAVGGVLLYHHAPTKVPGGWLGVSLFFTLSGFLIAGLALSERESSGKIDLLRFWSWRIRRLMPAALVALLLAAAVVLINDASTVREAAGDIRAAVLQIANWHFIGADSPYAAVDAAPSPVQHYWSLAIEEQFYLLFPLLIALSAWRRRILVPVLVGVVALGLVLQLSMGDLNRIYYGSDTRAPELAIGVLLAVLTPKLRTWFSDRRVADVIGAGGLLTLGILFLTAELDLGLVQSGALTVLPLVWCALIVGSVWGRELPRLLSAGPLPSMGRISYGIYLYHWPVYLLLTPDRTGLQGLTLLAVRVAVTLALATASARLLEIPIRQRRETEGRHGRTFAWAGAAATAMILVAVVLPSAAPRDETALVGGGFLTPGSNPVTTTTSPEPSVLAESEVNPAVATSVPEPSAPPTSDLAAPVTTTAPTPTTPTTVPTRPPRLLVVGDSTARATGTPMQQVASEHGLAEVYVRFMTGCALLPYEQARIREGYYFTPDCPDVIAEEVESLVDRHDIDTVVVFIGTPQLMDLRLSGMNGWHSILENSVINRYNDEAGLAIAQMTEIGVPILWADMPVPVWNLDDFSEILGFPVPGVGEPSTNAPERTKTLNRLDDAIAGSHRGVERWAYAEALAGPDGQIPPEARADGLHVDNEYGLAIARDRLFPLLEEAYRQVQARTGVAPDPEDLTAWDVPG